MKQLALAAVAASFPIWVSGADHLDIKTGLWEVTIKAVIAGTPRTNVNKSCLTKEKLDNPFSQLDKSCKIARNTCTSMAQDFTFECSVPRKSSGKVHFAASSPVTVAGTTELTSADDVGNPISIRMELQGKWVAAECGKDADG